MEAWEALSPFLAEEEPFLCRVALGRPGLRWRTADLRIIPFALQDAPVMPGPGNLELSQLAAAGSLGASLQGCSILWAQPHRQPPCVGTVPSPRSLRGWTLWVSSPMLGSDLDVKLVDAGR